MKNFICFALSLMMLLTLSPIAATASTDTAQAKEAITNIFMQPGGDITKRNFTWFSTSSEVGYVTFAKSADMVGGKFPADATKIQATRDHTGTSLKAGYYNNKATITVEAGNQYCYQLSNGTDASKIYTFSVGEESDTFSFAFITDPQIKGTTQSEVDGWNARWSSTLKQLTTDKTFKDVDFFLSGGDQINTDTSNPSYAVNEMQYDAFFGHEEIPTLAIASILGNHDNWSNGSHFQHFNEPNYIKNFATRNYYGYTKSSSSNVISGADYWFTYNSVLFVVLNVNDMGTSGGYPISRKAANTAARYHLEFIDKVLELNKDNTDIDWKVIVYHQSPYGSSYHNTFNFDTGSKYPERLLQYTRAEQHIFIDMREYLLPGIYERDFDVILSGHDHSYSRSHILKHEAIDTNGMYYGNETITPFESNGIVNYYTYEDGTTTPTYVSWSDANGIIHTNTKVASKPVKVTNPDGILHITGGSSGISGTGNTYEHPYAALSLTGADPDRQAIRIDVTPTTLTFTNYGLGKGNETYQNISEHVLDTFTIERTKVDRFTDVSPDAPYYSAVNYVVEEGLFNGTSKTTFAPDTTMTRSMFVTVLGRLAKADVSAYTTPTFKDVVAGQWYSSYVEWAAANNVVNGLGGGLFGINGNITVEQACTILYRYAEGKKATSAIGSTADFSDFASVSSWATDGVEWAVENGIYAGEAGKLNPSSAASRALMATMLENYVKNIK